MSVCLPVVQLFKYCGLVAGIVGYFIYVLWGMVFPEVQSASKGINILVNIIDCRRRRRRRRRGVGQKFSPFSGAPNEDIVQNHLT